MLHTRPTAEDHQVKVYLQKGVCCLGKKDSDDIINAVAGKGIHDTSLGLSDKERRSAAVSRGYKASAIMFGEAKEGAVEAHNFSSSASITTIHSKNTGNRGSVAMEKTLAKSVFSKGTSKVTSDGSEEEMEEDNESDSEAGSEKLGVAIKGMQMLTGHSTKSNKESMQDKASKEEEEEDKADKTLDLNYEEESPLTTNLSAATENLQLLSVDRDQDEGDKAEFGDAFNREGSIDPHSDNKGGKDFSKDNLSVHHNDLTLSDKYNTASKVSSGVFDATHSNKFEEPENFKQVLWKVAGPSSGSMIIMLDLLMDNLEADQAGLPADFNQIPLKLLEFMISNAGKDRKEQIKFVNEIMADLKQLGQTNYLNKAYSLEKGGSQPQEASKTQGTLPGAHKVSPTKEAAIEPAIMAGRGNEVAQSLSMAPTG